MFTYNEILTNNIKIINESNRMFIVDHNDG